jgi:hypothetical protein
VSTPVTMLTRRSGDATADFNPPATTSQPNSLDITGLVNKFRSLAGSPVKSIAQIQPNLPELNGDVGALDIVACVDAVRQFAYAQPGPCTCPSAATCGALACSGASTCTASGLPGLGANALCVKTCTGGANAGDPCVDNTPLHNHCPGGTCGSTGFCRDRCGRCN